MFQEQEHHYFAILLLSESISFENISKISCLSGGIVCKVGVVPINKEELLMEALQIIKLYNLSKIVI